MKWLDGLVAWLLRIFGGAEQRASDLQAGLDTVRRADEAAKSVQPDQDAIDNDPNNLDRPR